MGAMTKQQRVDLNGATVLVTGGRGGIAVEQNVFEGGRTVARTREAEQAVLAERSRLASTEQQVMLSAATVYMDVVRDQAVLELNRNNERVLQRQLEATRDRFQVGDPVVAMDRGEVRGRPGAVVAADPPQVLVCVDHQPSWRRRRRAGGS